MKLTTLSFVLLLGSTASALPLSRRDWSILDLLKAFNPQGTTAATAPASNAAYSGACAPVTFLFARGTEEPGLMGASVGPALESGLRSSKLGNDGVSVQGVDYPATWAGNLDGGKQGGAVLADLIGQAKAKCPDTKVVVGGYSQGAMVATQGAASKSSDIAAVVLYGNPFHISQKDKVGNVPQDLVMSFCAQGDSVCENGSAMITAAHMSYVNNGDIKLGVDFILSKVAP